MSEVHLHNTLTGRREPVPMADGKTVRLYVCGITPYDEPHLGHGRCYVVFDVLKRVLLRNGYAVKHIQNFTDVDDKIIDRALQKKADPVSYVNPFIDSFHVWMKKLNVLPADVYPRVTTHMPDIIALIEKLVSRGLGYVVDGGVYFPVRKFGPYGQLSKRKLDDMAAGARVEVDERKADPMDFALWKKAKPGEPAWDSPWGQGRPGWHIECSAMSMKYLGEEFDVHGGGLDLVFPHHENEIAQSSGATGKSFAKMWVHNGFVTINKEKMSKSLGNFFTLKEILDHVDPMSVRYFLLTQHYRGPLNFSDSDLKAAQSVWRDRISEAVRLAQSSKDEAVSGDAQIFLGEFDEALRADLNTPQALGALNQTVSLVFKKTPGAGRALTEMVEALGLSVGATEAGDEDAQYLMLQREQARKNKDWTSSDQLRDQLKSKGYLVEDTAQGPRLKKIL